MAKSSEIRSKNPGSVDGVGVHSIDGETGTCQALMGLGRVVMLVLFACQVKELVGGTPTRAMAGIFVDAEHQTADSPNLW